MRGLEAILESATEALIRSTSKTLKALDMGIRFAGSWYSVKTDSGEIKAEWVKEPHRPVADLEDSDEPTANDLRKYIGRMLADIEKKALGSTQPESAVLLSMTVDWEYGGTLRAERVPPGEDGGSGNIKVQLSS